MANELRQDLPVLRSEWHRGTFDASMNSPAAIEALPQQGSRPGVWWGPAPNSPVPGSTGWDIKHPQAEKPTR